MTALVLRSIHEVPASEWNALDLGSQPFLRHEFLAALEDTGCACDDTGWGAAHVLIRDPSTRQLLGAAPLYFKRHSFGEFVFDFSWADAYARAGLEYYPKLVNAIPFTPASGPRLLISPQADHARTAEHLLRAMEAVARESDCSSVHSLFTDEDSQAQLQQHGWLPRVSCQFQWHNRGFRDVGDFFAQFRADKRKKAQRERRRVTEQGICFKTFTGAELSLTDWQLIHALSAKTFHEHGNDHYLTAEFFHRIAQALPDQVMVKLAEHQGKAVATAIFFHSDTTLFGRYWGASENFHSLHFETCYYQGIEFCIERGIQHFEPGTQGEHKIARGFEPTLTHSAHYLRDARFAEAIAHYLQREQAAVAHYAEEMRGHVPFHRVDTAACEP